MRGFRPFCVSVSLLLASCGGGDNQGKTGPNGLVFQLNGENIVSDAEQPIELEIISAYNAFTFSYPSIETDEETGEQEVHLNSQVKLFIQRSLVGRVDTLYVNGNPLEPLPIELLGTGYDWTISNGDDVSYNSTEFWKWFIDATNHTLDLAAVSKSCDVDGEVVLENDITQECLQEIDFENVHSDSIPAGSTTKHLENNYTRISWPGTDDELQFTWTNQSTFLGSCRGALIVLDSELGNESAQEDIDSAINTVEKQCVTRLTEVLAELENSTVSPPPGVVTLTEDWLNDLKEFVSQIKIDSTNDIDTELYIEQRKAELLNDTNYYAIYNFPKTGDFTLSASFSYTTADEAPPAPITSQIRVTDPGLNEGIRRFYEECDIELEDLEEALQAHTESEGDADTVISAIDAASADCSEQIPPLLAYLQFNGETVPAGTVTLSEDWQTEIDSLLDQLRAEPNETQDQLDLLAGFRDQLAADEALIQAVIDNQ